MDEEEDTSTEEIIQDYNISSALSLSEAVTFETHNAFEGVGEDIIISIVSFIRDPINFGMSCKHFWRIISAFATYRIFEENLIINPDRFDLFLSPVSALSVPAALRAFGNGHTRVKAEFLVKNLELAFYSPEFRSAFDSRIWSHVSRVPAFKELTENVLMDSYDPLRLRRASSPEIEAHRRALIMILASLPEDVCLIVDFFREYPVPLLTPSASNEICFHKFVSSIAKRVSLLPTYLIINSVLPLFYFDSRLIHELVIVFLQRAQYSPIRALFKVQLSDELKISGQTYVGCVVVQQFVHLVEQYLNSFDDGIQEILLELEQRVPIYIPNLFLSLLELYHPQALSSNEIFHVAVLKSLWNVLEAFEDFNFSYGKDDSEFMSVLINRDPDMATNLLNRVPRMASHKAFLLNSQFKHRHFSSFGNLRAARIELKRTISCPEITRSHINYIQDSQDRLYTLLLADSSYRISNYFTMNLKGHERKRYKEHPSFTIALTTLDVFFECRFSRFSDNPEGVDPELVLQQMFIDLNVMPSKPEEYFELAHGLPSFAKALLAGGLNEEDTLIVPEAALTQNIAEFELLSHTIALNRVIHDGSSLNYRLLLNWFDHFGLDIVKIIPIWELKALLKGAAFHSIRSLEDKKLRFELDAQLQNNPFSMIYRYAVIIIATQSKGVPAAVYKRLNSLFPGIADDNDIDQLNDLVGQACEFYRLHASGFFSKFKFVATNSRAERFLIDFIRHFIKINGLKRAHPSEIIRKFFNFINLNTDAETLLRDHFTYFILLASFRKRN